MDKAYYKKYFENSNLLNEIEELDLKDIFRGILRKKKWFILTTGIFFSGSIIFTLHGRIFNPIFKGSFALLIDDPMYNTNFDSNPNNSSSTLFQQITDNKNEYEINTLITLLRSPVFIEPVAKEFKISTNFLKNNISISQSVNSNKISKGILNFNLFYGKQKEGAKILERLSENYLQASLDQKQKKLKDGLDFLNAQAPQILKKKNELQKELVSFREKYKLVKPSQESTIIKERQINNENVLLELRTKRNRLENVRREIEDGTITARGFKKEMGDGLSITDFDQGLLQQLINVENEIALAKSKYTNESIVIKGLTQ